MVIIMNPIKNLSLLTIKNKNISHPGKAIIAASFAGLLSACSPAPNVSYTYIKTDSNMTQAEDPQTQAQLVAAAASVSESLQQLSSIQQATHPGVKLNSYRQYDSIGKQHTASLNWNGPVVPALKTIAKTINYKLNVLGRDPAVPALVTISVTNEPISTILRNINYQLTLNNTASIKVYPKRRIIELRYSQ